MMNDAIWSYDFYTAMDDDHDTADYNAHNDIHDDYYNAFLDKSYEDSYEWVGTHDGKPRFEEHEAMPTDLDWTPPPSVLSAPLSKYGFEKIANSTSITTRCADREEALANLVTESECRALFYHVHDYPANKGSPVVLDGHQFFSTANQKPVEGRATGLCVLSSDPLVASDRALAVNGKILFPGDVLWTNLVSDVPLCDVHACQCFDARSSPPMHQVT